MPEPIRIVSAVTEVEVFRSGALVTRTASSVAGGSAADPTSDGELSFDDLPLSLQDESVRVSVEPSSGLVPSDVRVVLALPAAGQPLEEPSRKEIREVERSIAGLTGRLARLDREDSRLDRIQPKLPEPFANRVPRPAPAAAWRGAIDWIEDERAGRLTERSRLQEELRRAEESHARLCRAEAEARARRDSRVDSVRKSVVFRLRPVGGIHAGSHEGSVPVRLQYQVPGAWWSPSYVFRMARDGRSASLGVRAQVVQRTGEPWTGVRLALSTADLKRETELPELRSIRIGRSQPEPPARAWREPPTGLEALFEGLDEALARRPAPSAPPEPPRPPRVEPPSVAPYGEAQESEPSEATGAFSLPVPRKPGGMMKRAARPATESPALLAPPPPPPAPAPMQAMARASAAPAASMAMVGGAMREYEPQEEGAGADFDEMPREQLAASGAAPAPLPDADALRYGALTMSGWSDGATRGRLSPVRPDGELLSRVRSETARAQAVEGVGLPPGGVPIRESAGSFDFRYVAEGPVDVPSDGRPHGISLYARTADVVTSLVAVPRESPDAVRVATLKNPLRVPLLAGPAEIYLGDEFLVSSPIRTVPASGEVSVGLGVEERLKIARNTHFSEESHGMLGGGTTLLHQVEIEVASRLPRPAYVEIRERVPVKDELDRDVTIVVGDASPPWSDYDQPEAPIRGGKRWRFELGASETRKLTFSYQVRIDGKNELVGGNRRERS